MSKNRTAALKETLGADKVKKTDVTKVLVTKIKFAPKGHALEHPRANDPINRGLVDDIKENGVKETILLWDDGEDPITHEPRLYVIDGSQRVIHALVADEELGVDKLFVKVDFFSGTESEALLERARRNADPFKRPDSARVLYLTFAAAQKYGATVEDMIKVAPKGIGRAEVDALLDFGRLVPDVAARFDSVEVLALPLRGIGLLAAVLAAPREQQMDRLETLLAKGVTSTRGATRAVNREKREKTGAPVERVNARTLTKVREELQGWVDESPCSAEIDNDDDTDEDREIKTSCLLRGALIMARYAEGDVSALDELPVDVRDGVKKRLARKESRKSDSK